jgi:hypothetical protein
LNDINRLTRAGTGEVSHASLGAGLRQSVD